MVATIPTKLDREVIAILRQRTGGKRGINREIRKLLGLPVGPYRRSGLVYKKRNK